MIRHPFLRGLAWLGSLVCLIAAVAVGLGTAWFWQAFAGQGQVTTSLGAIPIDPGARAIIVDIERVEAVVPNLPVRIATLITVKSGEDRPGADPADLFLGVAPAATVDAYLQGSPYAVARLDDGKWSVTKVPGEGALTSPQSVPWSAADQGPAPSVPLDGNAPVTVTIANGDLSAPVDVRVFLVMVILDASTYQAWAVALAIALVVLAWTFGYVAMVRLAPRPREWTSER